MYIYLGLALWPTLFLLVIINLQTGCLSRFYAVQLPSPTVYELDDWAVLHVFRDSLLTFVFFNLYFYMIILKQCV